MSPLLFVTIFFAMRILLWWYLSQFCATWTKRGSGEVQCKAWTITTNCFLKSVLIWYFFREIFCSANSDLFSKGYFSYLADWYEVNFIFCYTNDLQKMDEAYEVLVMISMWIINVVVVNGDGKNCGLYCWVWSWGLNTSSAAPSSQETWSPRLRFLPWRSKGLLWRCWFWVERVMLVMMRVVVMVVTTRMVEMVGMVTSSNMALLTSLATTLEKCGARSFVNWPLPHLVHGQATWATIKIMVNVTCQRSKRAKFY